EEQQKLAEKKRKGLIDDFDRFIKLATQKEWGPGASFLTWPVIEGFASPLKIQQYTLNDLPIDYSFKHVTRYDRSTTCHPGVEKAGYDKESLAALGENPDKTLKTRFKVAQKILERRKAEAGDKDLPDPKDLEPRTLAMTAGRVTQFCSHPR